MNNQDYQSLSAPSKGIIYCTAAAYVVAVGLSVVANFSAAPTITVALLWSFVDAMFLAIFGVCGGACLVAGTELLVQLLADGKLKKEDPGIDGTVGEPAIAQ